MSIHLPVVAFRFKLGFQSNADQRTARMERKCGKLICFPGRPSARILCPQIRELLITPLSTDYIVTAVMTTRSITLGEVERRFLLKECGIFANSPSYLIKPNPRIH